MTKQLLLTLLVIVAPISAAFAQSAQPESGAGMDEIENLFSKDEQVEPSVPRATPAPGQAKPDAGQTQIKDVSDLGKLQSFNDIAVIQRRFLPKTNRWELFVGPALNLNDAFFVNFGGSAHFGYYFRERYGVEAIATLLTVTERQVTTDLRDRRGVTTTSFITPRGYYGLDFKWAPMYGKMTWRNKKITPFDLYFSFGAGLTSDNQGGSNATLHLGTGQIFALSKSNAVRWDFSWHMFTAKSSVDTSGSSSLYHNLLFTIGWSWFFPEATYR